MKKAPHVSLAYTVHLDLPDPCPLVLSDVEYNRPAETGQEPVYLLRLSIRNGTLDGSYVRENKDGRPSRLARRVGYRNADQVNALLAKLGYSDLMKALDRAYPMALDAASGYIEFAVRDNPRKVGL